jgi:hypothetical protein
VPDISLRAERGYFMVEDGRDELVIRSALVVLRDQLATVWLDAVPLAAGWPSDVVEEAAALRSRADAAAEPRARRRGTGPDTVVLDPVRDDDFALVQALAPFSAAVEGMSLGGQLLVTRGRTSDGLRLRLTTSERAGLVALLKDDARYLTATGRPNAGREKRSTGWQFVSWVIALVVAGPLLVLPAVGVLTSRPGFGDGVHAGMSVLAGLWLMGEGLLVVLARLRRFSRGRGWAAASR